MQDQHPDERKEDHRKDDHHKDVGFRKDIEFREAAAGGQSSPNGAGQRPAGTSRRGFAAMDEQTQREIASKGGTARDAKLTPEQRSELARELNRIRWSKPKVTEIKRNKARAA